MNDQNRLRTLAGEFAIDGRFIGARSYGSGHINDTYRVTLRAASRPVHFILQRINQTVFINPLAITENIQRVTAHIAANLQGEDECNRRVLALIPTRQGSLLHLDEGGSSWRAYHFIERASSYDSVRSARQAYEAARAFGNFQRLLIDLPPPALNTTLPDFHNTPLRFRRLEQAISGDPFGRLHSAVAEADFALGREPLSEILTAARLPERIAHNDTKLSNVMLDDITGEGVCVIDLDTVMPGLAVVDFGDMVRTATSPVLEDEQNLSKVTMQFPMFEALLRGYLGAAEPFLVEAEKASLVAAAKVITFEQGIRFLTDHLTGDPYYKTLRKDHNLDRCRTQFQLLRSIEEQADRMQQLVESVLSGSSSAVDD